MATITVAQSNHDSKQTTYLNYPADNLCETVIADNYFAMKYVVAIPAGSTILTAYQRLYVHAHIDDRFLAKEVYCQRSNNPANFTSGSNNISARPRTTAKVNTTSMGQPGQGWVNTISFVSIVQEVIDNHSGCASLVFIWKALDSQDLAIRAWDYGSELHQLIITWAAPKTLTTSSGSGGSVTNPGEGSFPGYAPGAVVDIFADPDPGHAFVDWTGDTGDIADTTDPSTTITMNADYSITANFVNVNITTGYRIGLRRMLMGMQ